MKHGPSPRTLRAGTVVALYCALLLLFPAMARAEVESSADKTTAVLVAPFQVRSDEDLSYLSEGLANMLTSRLSVHEDLTIIDEAVAISDMRERGMPSLDLESARSLGNRANADHVVVGTFTKSGEDITFEVMIVDVSADKPPIAVLYHEQTMKRLMEGVTVLAELIHHKIKGVEVIADITIRGNRLIEDDAILYQLSIKPGGVFTPDKIQEAIREIYRMGFFSDIQVDSADDAMGKKIVFMVKENPEIAEIRITGNLEISTDQVQEQLDLLPHTILDYNKVKDNVAKIKTFYKGKGYYNALVDHAVDPAGDDKAIVTFQIVEHHPMRIKEVNFVGNENIKAKKLRKIMETREKGLFSFITDSGLFKEEALQQDLDRLRAYYYDNGYMDVKVSESEVNHDDEWIYVNIPIEEGPQYTVSQVSVTGDLVADAQLIQEKYIKLAPGQIFSRQKIRDDIAALTDLYGEHGYAFSDITPLTKINADDRTIGVTG